MNFKKLLSAVVAGTMVLGTMAAPAFAEEETSLPSTDAEITLLSGVDTTNSNSELTTLENIAVEAIVQEGIGAKLSLMPENTRYKLSNTVTKIVNKGSNN